MKNKRRKDCFTPEELIIIVQQNRGILILPTNVCLEERCISQNMNHISLTPKATLGIIQRSKHPLFYCQDAKFNNNRGSDSYFILRSLFSVSYVFL